VLKKSKSLLAHHMQAASQSLNALCRKPLSTMMTVIVIAVTLSLPALFWLFTDNLSHLTLGWQHGGHISLYVKLNTSVVDEKELLQKIRKVPGVGHADLKSADQGLVELTKQEGMQDIMRYLPDNPLPSVIEITPSLTIDSPAKLDLLSRDLGALPHIEQAKVDMEWVNRLHSVFGFATKAAHALMALLALAIILIVGNTLRLAIHNRHEEIQVMKLIGATDKFIMRPFLYSGIWYGLAGAVVAVFLVNIFILSIGSAVDKLAVVYQMHYPLSSLSIRQILLLILFAIILGWFGARLSIKRQLASIEPYK